jgi:hypothetical protein
VGVDLDPTDLKERDRDGDQTVFGGSRCKTTRFDDVAGWGGIQVEQERVPELGNLLLARREVDDKDAPD